MFLEWPFRDTKVHIIVPKNTERRLRPLCFRGSHCQKAGNFAKWRHPLDVFRDPWVKEGFSIELHTLYTEKSFELRSVTVEHPEMIGWESTDTHESYGDTVLEAFNPNWKSAALRVRKDHSEILAPATKLVTIVFTFDIDKNNRNRFAAVIHSLYPGEDIGPLEGDVTAREERVFFDWSHPGAPLTTTE